jgi:hypothetical protein
MATAKVSRTRRAIILLPPCVGLTAPFWLSMSARQMPFVNSLISLKDAKNGREKAM